MFVAYVTLRNMMAFGSLYFLVLVKALQELFH